LISDAKEKEEIDKLMSSNQITEARELARAWIKKHKDH
jgi:hypothetical protein